jgi:hypothetical protein
MKMELNAIGRLALIVAVTVPLPVVAQEKKAEEKKAEKAEKAKAEKVAGDIGLLDTEKNYTELKEKPAKMSDIGLGASATVEYTQKGEKNYLSKIEFLPAKGGD